MKFTINHEESKHWKIEKLYSSRGEWEYEKRLGIDER